MAKATSIPNTAPEAPIIGMSLLFFKIVSVITILSLIYISLLGFSENSLIKS